MNTQLWSLFLDTFSECGIRRRHSPRGSAAGCPWRSESGRRGASLIGLASWGVPLQDEVEGLGGEHPSHEGEVVGGLVCLLPVVGGEDDLVEAGHDGVPGLLLRGAGASRCDQEGEEPSHVCVPWGGRILAGSTSAPSRPGFSK